MSSTSLILLSIWICRFSRPALRCSHQTVVESTSRKRRPGTTFRLGGSEAADSQLRSIRSAAHETGREKAAQRLETKGEVGSWGQFPVFFWGAGIWLRLTVFWRGWRLWCFFWRWRKLILRDLLLFLWGCDWKFELLKRRRFLGVEGRVRVLNP